MTDQLLTPEEAAGLLRVTVSTIRAMTRDQRLPRLRGIRHIRIPRSAVDFRGVCGPLWLGVCRVRITRA